MSMIQREKDAMDYRFVEKKMALLPKPAHKHVPLILQIIPASVEKWAKFKEDSGNYSYCRVELWALVQTEDGERYVYGMESDEYMDFIDDIANFAGYVSKEDMKKNKN